MNILLVTPMPPDPHAASAIPRLLHAQLGGLRKRHDVTLVTVAGPDAVELDAIERLRGDGLDVQAAARRLKGQTLGWRRRLRIVGTWTGRRVPFRTAWFAEPEVQVILDAFARRRIFDIVLVEDNAMGAFRLPPGTPAVLTEHEVRRPRPLTPPPRALRRWPQWAFGELDWRRWPTYERSVWRRFDALQVFSSRDAAAVAALAPDVAPRIHVNPFAIELPRRRQLPEEPDTVLFAGNYAHPPNRDAALWLGREILPRLTRLHPRVSLSLVGPAAPPEVRQLAGRNVRFLGHVQDLDALIERAALILAPVRTGGGMRMKVLHAMALGKAVVTTPRGAEGFGLGDAPPPLAVAEDEDDLAAVAARLLRDAAARAELGTRARAYAERWHSPEAYVDRLDDAIAAALARRNGSAPA